MGKEKSEIWFVSYDAGDGAVVYRFSSKHKAFERLVQLGSGTIFSYEDFKKRYGLQQPSPKVNGLDT